MIPTITWPMTMPIVESLQFTRTSGVSPTPHMLTLGGVALTLGGVALTITK